MLSSKRPVHPASLARDRFLQRTGMLNVAEHSELPVNYHFSYFLYNNLFRASLLRNLPLPPCAAMVPTLCGQAAPRECMMPTLVHTHT